MWSDPRVTRFVGGVASTETRTWSRIAGYLGGWALSGFGYWAVEEKATRRFVGDVGFADFHREIDAEMRDVPELGWALASDHHGRGYGTEAVRAAVAWGDAHLASARTVCLIDAANAVSIRLAERRGYRAFRRPTWSDRPTIFFERLRP